MLLIIACICMRESTLNIEIGYVHAHASDGSVIIHAYRYNKIYNIERNMYREKYMYTYKYMCIYI